MPVPRQDITFGSLEAIGATMTLSRGPKPASCRIRVPHYQDEDISGDSDLSIESNAGPITFAGMRADLSTVRPDHGPKRKREWVFTAWDRRAQWAKRLVNGSYNVRHRDCTVQSSTQKTLGELWDLALQACDEPSGSYLSGVNVYPSADWSNASAVSAMESLAALYPATVCRQSDDSFSVKETDDGDDLPDQVTNPTTIPVFTATIERGPSKVRVRCGPTLFQCFLQLEAVGRDVDGSIVPINSLSYTPAGGWANEHPYFFAGVVIGSRHLAFKTVYKMYRVSVQSVPGCSASVSDVGQFDLDDLLVSTAGSGNNKYPIPAFVKGCFWPYSDHFVNTGSCVHWGGQFTIDNDSKCVIFDVPVFKAGSCIDPADLWLCTGFRVRDPSTNDFVRKDFDVDRDTGQGEQVVEAPWLWETSVESFLLSCANSGSPTKNTTTIQTEAELIANAWKDHWNACKEVQDAIYSGTIPVSLGGRLSQVTYEIAQGRPPTTRVSKFYAHNALMR